VGHAAGAGAVGGTNSESEMPMCRKKHSAGSQPLVNAMSGMSPSIEFAGKRNFIAGVAGFGISFGSHALTVSPVSCRLHLPVCATRVTFVPLGTPN
jgi:hypothetical protein